MDHSTPANRWLLLIHRIPPKPDYLRVKVRRRLTRLGAVPLKNSVYVLPLSDEAVEDLQWLSREIIGDGGEATVCEAQFVDDAVDAQLAEQFGMAAGSARAASAPTMPRGATWVTRRGVHIDRIASAWLIRRFIDPEATFSFVAARGHKPSAGELRFDMFDAEYTHEGDRCTFETLIEHFGLRDKALQAIAEVVHDIDCKDGKFGRAEAAGVAGVIGGIVGAHGEDETRIERGAAMLDDLYANFQRRRR
jgi:hypothetical protein